jgi:uncharacterized membrane protein required for colicin V production
MEWSVIIIICIVILAIIVLLDIIVPSFRENIGKTIGIEFGVIIFVVIIFVLYKLFNNQQNTNSTPVLNTRESQTGIGHELLYDPTNT